MLTSWLEYKQWQDGLKSNDTEVKFIQRLKNKSPLPNQTIGWYKEHKFEQTQECCPFTIQAYTKYRLSAQYMIQGQASQSFA